MRDRERHRERGGCKAWVNAKQNYSKTAHGVKAMIKICSIAHETHHPTPLDKPSAPPGVEQPPSACRHY